MIPYDAPPTPAELAEIEYRVQLEKRWDRMEALAERGRWLKEQEADALDSMLVGGAVDALLMTIIPGRVRRARKN